MPGDPLWQFILGYMSSGERPKRNAERAVVIPVSLIWLTYLKLALLCPLVLISSKWWLFANKGIGPKYCSKEKDTSPSIHKIIIAEKKEYTKWDKDIFY